MDAVFLLAALIVALVVFDLMAVRFGVDSRHTDAGHDWW